MTTGRTVLVTGASRGIGAEIAAGLAEPGTHIVTIARSDADETTRRIETAGGTAEHHRIDLADPGAVRDAIAGLSTNHDFDVLVNNAGMITRSPSADLHFGQWQKLVDTNLTATWLLSQAVGAAMAKRGSGKILTIASLLSFQGGVEVAGYAATKHAVVGLTKALCNEWASRGVQINAIAPGYIRTRNTEPLRADTTREAEILSRIPAGRWGEPNDLVGAARFLTSRASDYVNGHTLVVDGGWLAR